MDDDVLDKEMDHIFHDDDIETLSKLNPSAGELDEERKNYYRCWTDVKPQQTIIHFLRVASSDDTATSEFASPASEAEPMTGELCSWFSVRHVEFVRQILVHIVPC